MLDKINSNLNDSSVFFEDRKKCNESYNN